MKGEQILVHFYAEKLLFLRYCFREALKSIKGTVFRKAFINT